MARISVTAWVERKIEAMQVGQVLELDCGVTVERKIYRWSVRREIGGVTMCRSIGRAAKVAVALMNKK